MKKEQYYGIQVKIQKEILYPDQNLEKKNRKRNTILPGQKLKSVRPNKSIGGAAKNSGFLLDISGEKEPGQTEKLRKPSV